MKKFILGLCLSLLVIKAHGLGFDIGNCGCMCDDGDATDTISGNFLSASTSTPKSSFFQNIRGQRGDVGENGAIGDYGDQGTAGSPGVRGPAAPDILARKSTIPTSCKELVGSKSSGIYTIKTPINQEEVEVYCDLESVGGGWQLVASVHENNIAGKCTNGDNWSGNLGTRGKPTNSWSNYATFGQVDSATSEDYKSPSYYDSTASDVMVWHVPNNKLASEWNEASFLQYHTNNHFLKQFGGNLQTLYSKHYPLEYKNSSVETAALATYMDGLDASLNEITSNLPQFFPYTYDGSNDGMMIGDGGNDMYDGGNELWFSVQRDQWQRARYTEKYFDFENGFQMYSRKTHPFISLAWIENPDGQNDAFGIKVSSDTGADGEGSTTSYVGTVHQDNVDCDYNFYNVYGSHDPSIGELYFSCSSTRWNSTVGRFERGQWSSDTSRINNAVYTSGHPQNVLMGFMLLSKWSGSNSDSYSDVQVQNSLRILMRSMSNFTGGESLVCDRSSQSLVQPIEITKGSADVLLEGLADQITSKITPGYIQFRPMSFSGKPYALSSGLKAGNCDPGLVSYGGVPRQSGKFEDKDNNNCGDFAGWNEARNATSEEVQTHGIGASVLIFTR